QDGPRHPRQLRRTSIQCPRLARPARALRLPIHANPHAPGSMRSIAFSPGCRLKRGLFRSVVDSQAAINRFLAETNAEPKPFTWTADPDKIIAAVRRGHQALDSI